MERILIIEDDPDILNVLRECIADTGCKIEHAADGRSGLALALAESFSLVILDLSLPELGGIEVCRSLRKERADLAILILTSRAEEIDKVVGLELGADDYVTKPFSVRELAARVKALLRRARLHPAGTDATAAPAPEKSEVLVRGEIRINLARHTVSLSGAQIQLTPAEYELLLTLASNPGRAFTREQLTETLYGFSANSYASIVTAHLSRLRMKIEPNRKAPRYILTVKGVGYRFAAEDELV